MTHEGSFTDTNGQSVTVGDFVEYQYQSGFAKVLDVMQDGDATIDFGGDIQTVKWVRLAKASAPAPLPMTPVKGYKPQSPEAVALVNQFKLDEERLLRKLDAMDYAAGAAQSPGPYDIDDLIEGRKYLRIAFMLINRAVFQPGRVALPEDEGK